MSNQFLSRALSSIDKVLELLAKIWKESRGDNINIHELDDRLQRIQGELLRKVKCDNQFKNSLDDLSGEILDLIGDEKKGLVGCLAVDYTKSTKKSFGSKFVPIFKLRLLGGCGFAQKKGLSDFVSELDGIWFNLTKVGTTTTLQSLFPMESDEHGNETLGSGFFTTTYRVKSKLDSQLYAMKEIDKRRLTGNKIDRNDILQEVQMLTSLSHPNIIRYHCSFEDGRFFNIITELAGGGSLADILTRATKVGGDFQTPLTTEEEQLVRWYQQALSALTYMHEEKHILHRDIKPENILLSSTNEVKLADLGLACTQNISMANFTVTGTPIYASYEKATPELSYDGRDDVWGLGCVFAELLTGRRLSDWLVNFSGAFSNNNSMTNSKRAEVMEACSVNVNDYQVLVACTERALTWDVSLRPTANALLQFLETDLEARLAAQATAQGCSSSEDLLVHDLAEPKFMLSKEELEDIVQTQLIETNQKLTETNKRLEEVLTRNENLESSLKELMNMKMEEMFGKLLSGVTERISTSFTVLQNVNDDMHNKLIENNKRLEEIVTTKTKHEFESCLNLVNVKLEASKNQIELLSSNITNKNNDISQEIKQMRCNINEMEAKHTTIETALQTVKEVVTKNGLETTELHAQIKDSQVQQQRNLNTLVNNTNHLIIEKHENMLKIMQAISAASELNIQQLHVSQQENHHIVCNTINEASNRIDLLSSHTANTKNSVVNNISQEIQQMRCNINEMEAKHTTIIETALQAVKEVVTKNGLETTKLHAQIKDSQVQQQRNLNTLVNTSNHLIIEKHENMLKNMQAISSASELNIQQLHVSQQENHHIVCNTINEASNVVNNAALSIQVSSAPIENIILKLNEMDTFIQTDFRNRNDEISRLQTLKPLTNETLREALKNLSFATLLYGHISTWDTSNVTNMNELFRSNTTFNESIENWDTHNVRSMAGMFYGASSFNQPLEKWNVSNVANMQHMFYGASSFNQPLEQWNVSNVRNMENMFYGAGCFNQPLEKWNVSHVTDMVYMFNGASSFNQPLEQWNVSNVKNMASMFYNARSFNQPLEKWNVSNVISMSCMFYNANSFNQPLKKWDVSNVTDIGSSMFHGAKRSTVFRS